MTRSVHTETDDLITRNNKFKMSPTPWKVNQDASGDIFISAADNSYVCEIGCPLDDECALSDARFLVAAVNAAAGTSIEQLEDPDG
jgi:hypothetical protein